MRRITKRFFVKFIASSFLLDFLLKRVYHQNGAGSIVSAKMRQRKAFVSSHEEHEQSGKEHLCPAAHPVDDRLYETNFPDIMMESEILAELQSKPLPDNVHAAFLKTCYNFADKMGLKLNLREHKQTHSYCWSTSSSSNVFYVDMNLKTYRCTCTVGRSRYSLFDFSYENLTNYRPVAVTCNSYAECKDCKIGGFCGGGCQLSHQIDFKKCCTYEEEVFSHFMKTLFIPYIKSKYNEVNQNERKAENRCT